MKKCRLEINLIKVTQLINDRTGIQIQIHLILKLLFLITKPLTKKFATQFL